MTRLVPILLLLVSIVTLGVLPGQLRNSVTLAWDGYPPGELSTNLTFKVYSSTNPAVPLTNWQVFTNVVGTNTSVVIVMQPEQRFFFVTASNLWGESTPSNVAGSPPPPRDNLTVRLQ